MHRCSDFSLHVNEANLATTNVGKIQFVHKHQYMVYKLLFLLISVFCFPINHYTLRRIIGSNYMCACTYFIIY